MNIISIICFSLAILVLLGCIICVTVVQRGNWRRRKIMKKAALEGERKFFEQYVAEEIYKVARSLKDKLSWPERVALAGINVGKRVQIVREKLLDELTI